jgi:MFS family permease
VDFAVSLVGREYRGWVRGEGSTALRRETTAGSMAKAADPGARSTSEESGGDGQDGNSLPVLQSRLVTALMEKSPAIRVLLSGSPAFRILMIGSSISMFGSRISTVAFPMLVLHLNNSPLITGLVAFAAIAPSMLVYIPAGVLVDRWNPRRVMLVSELLRGLAIASVVVLLLVFGRHINIWLLIIAMVCEEILEIFSTLADRRYLSGLMEGENRVSRQAYIEVRTHAVVLAGRPVGPFLFALNWLFPFVADAMSFVFSVGILLVLRASNEPVRPQQRLHLRQMRSDTSEGFSWLRKHRRASLTIVLMAVTSLVSQALIMMFLVEAHSSKLSTLAIGVVLAASGAGGAAGSISVKFLPDELRRFWLPIQMVAWSVALAFLTIAGGMSASWSAIAMFILGFTGAIGNIEFGTYLVANVAEDLLARVTSIGQMLAIGASALGPVLGGAAIQEYGLRGAIQVLLYLVLALAGCSLILPELARPITRAALLVVRVLYLIGLFMVIGTAISCCVLAVRGLTFLQSVPASRPVTAELRREESRQIGQVSSETSSGFACAQNSRPLSIILFSPLTCGYSEAQYAGWLMACIAIS